MVVGGVVSFLFSVGLIERILALKLLQHIWGYNRLHRSTDTVIASSFTAKQSKRYQKNPPCMDCFAEESSLAMTKVVECNQYREHTHKKTGRFLQTCPFFNTKYLKSMRQDF